MESRIELAKKICKNHGVKGFKKMALSRVVYVAGRQTVQMTDFIANRLLDRLTEEGFNIGNMDTCRALANKGHLDCISIYF